MQPDQLVAELLARGDMNDETTLDLNRIMNDWRAGKLDPEDEAYLVAFHARIMHLTPDLDEPALDDRSLSVPDRLDGLSIEEWRDRALKAEAELSQIEETARSG